MKNILATAEFILSNYYVQQLSRGNVRIPDVDTAYTVQVCSGHTLKCDCQQFARTNNFCCHVIAVAEKGHYLHKFLAIYPKNGDDPNRVVQNSLPRRVPKPQRSTEYFNNTEILIYENYSAVNVEWNHMGSLLSLCERMNLILFRSGTSLSKMQLGFRGL